MTSARFVPPSLARLLGVSVVSMVGVWCPAQAASGPGVTQLTHRVQVAPRDVALRHADGGTIITLRGGVPAADLGAPAIPELPLTLAIPADRSVLGVRAVVESEEELARDVTVAPVTEVGPDGARTEPVRPEWHQGAVLEARGEGYMRGFKLATFVVRPVRYAQGRVSVATSVRLVVELGARWDDGPVPLVRERAETSAESADRVRRLVANPHDVLAGWRAAEAQPLALRDQGDAYAPASRPTTDGSTVDYVIVTVDSLAGAFQAYADWKTQLGLQTVVRTVSWVTANYPGGADRAETIRTFLRDAYRNWGLSYVLLAGDAAVIPYRSGRTTYFGGDEIPADLYFQCLDGNWNADGDSLYGEGFVDLTRTGDEVDLYPEIFVGRAPVTTTADVTVWVNKTRAYTESMPATLANKVLFASEVLFPSDWNGDGRPVQLDGAFLTEDVRAYFPPSVSLTRLYQNNTAYPGSLAETLAGFIDSVNAGYALIEHMGHGFRNTLSIGDASLTNAHVDALTNGARQGVIYSVNCNSASFEFNSIAERFLLNPNGGAVAYIGATRYDFPTTVWVYQTEFFRLAFHDTTFYSLGQAHALSKAPYAPFSFNDNSHRWTQMAVILLGDPTLDFFWRAPRTFSAAVPAVVVGQQSVSVTVTAGGQPVAGARVTLAKTGESYASAETNASGIATVPFRPATTGSATVGVSRPGDRSTVSTFTVGATLLPALSWTSITTRDGVSGFGTGNGDAVPDAGETVSLLFPIKNTGAATATTVTASFATKDPLVTVTDSTSAYGGIAVNVTATGDEFLLALDGTTPDQHEVIGVLTMRDGSGRVWQSPVSFGVAAPALAIAARAVRDTIVGDGDGVAESGEVVAYRLSLQNLGKGAAHGLTVHLKARDATTTIQDSTQVFSGDLLSMQTGTGSDWMRFTVSSGTAHAFMCWVTDWTGRELLRRPLDLTAPGTPSNVEVIGNATDISFVWTAVTSADLYGYAVYRSSVPGGPYVRANAALDVRTAYYRDEGLPPFSRYYFRISAVDSSGNEGALSTEITGTTNPPLHSGWPVDLGRSTAGSPVFANVDGSVDGSLEIVAGADRVYVLRADATEVIDGDQDPRTLGVFAPVGLYFAASCGVADVDLDGKQDIVAASFNSGVAPLDTTTIWVLDGTTGLTKAGWPRAYPKFGWATPAIGNIDATAQPEIVTASADGWMYAWHFDGSNVLTADATVSGRFSNMGSTFTYTSPALADLDHDGQAEIVIGSNGGALYALNADGTSVSGFPRFFGGGISSSPAIADLGGDGVLDIVFGTANNEFHCVTETGADKWVRYFQQGGTSRAPSPAIGDIDGDGALDVVTASTGGASGARIYAMRGDTGVELAAWKAADLTDGVFYGTGTSGVSECSPILADIDGNGTVDVLMGAEDGKLYGLTSAAQPAAGFPISLPGEVRGAPSVWDIDGDGLSEIVYTGWDQALYVWDLPGAFNQAKAPWPVFHHDVRHTGVAGNPIVQNAEGFVPVAASVTPRALSVRCAPSLVRAGRAAFTVTVPNDALLAHVRVDVLDVSGRIVAQVHDAPLLPGMHAVHWNDTRARAGVYAVRVTRGAQHATERIVVMP